MEEKEFDYINMIPFIDVMLVLLTIVLTTSTFVATGVIPVELPRVTGKHERALKNTLVEIDRRSIIYYGGKAVTLVMLRNEIQGLPRDTPVLVRADRSVPLQSFVDVMDTIKTLGFGKVSLQTEEMSR
jgi:biopolymer transport protein ExbD